MRRTTVAGAALLLASAAGLLVDARLWLACWLAAWWWCLGLVLGLAANAWMHALTGGAWGLALRPTALALASRLPRVLLAFVPVAAGWQVLFPWADGPSTSSGQTAAWLHGIAHPGFLQAWFAPPFFFGRLVGYALAWWWLARSAVPVRKKPVLSLSKEPVLSLSKEPVLSLSKGRAAGCLIVHCIVTSLAAVDLLMSLAPGWYSTAFGLVALASQALSGAAFAVFVQPHRPGACPEPVEGPTPQDAKQPPVSRDLGNLLLMWVMGWAYLAFMQFLIIWAEDLPREISWYVPRLQTGWVLAGVALVLLQLALPFFALLSRAVKDHPARLARVAALLLFATAVDAAWMVVPSVAPHSLHAWWLLPLTFAGLALLLFGNLPAAPRDVRPGPVEELRHAHS